MKKTALVLLALLTLGCNRDGVVTLNGRVEAYLSDLGPRVPGTILSIDVKEGQRVKAGDLLVRLSAAELGSAVDRDAAGLASAEARNRMYRAGNRPEDIAQGEARVRDAQAALALATDTHKRVASLHGDRIASRADLDKAVADRDRAEAALHLQKKALDELRAGFRAEDRAGAEADARKARAVLDQSRVQASFLEIRAPFDCVVIHRLREVGSVVGASQAVLTVARLDELWVRLYIPQPLQPRVAQGMPLQVATLDGRTFDAALDEVNSVPEYTPKMVETAEERINLVYPAQVHLARGWDKGLIPGVAVDVKLKPRGK
ncbi:HlyD family secretion protein [Geothrix sp. 21YS21S-2]|uniref:HlyD family secretion protein n=1 Tax=Geothrix sp. 21YS21S-2 TaxID=3068893 RepID=UPI0027BAB089|nr:HlyD family efflux transporter periplasmic adaptor subunit [Geothrix sp. 21YS21S-2]